MSLRRHLAWMALSQGCYFVIQFAGSVVVAHLLSPYETGVYTFALAVVGVIGMVQAFGLSGFVVREPNLDRDTMATAFTLNLAISLTLALAIAGMGLLGGAVLHAPGVQRVMLILAVLPLIGLFEFLPAANLERNANFKAIALIGAGQTVTAQGVTVALAWHGFSYMSMAYGQAAAAIFTATAYNLVGRQHVSLRLRLVEWRRIGAFGLQMLAINGVNVASSRTADILLGGIVGLSALGLYGRASSLNGLLWTNIHMVIGRVVFVDMAAQVRAGGSLRDGYLRTVEILTALLWPAFAGLAIVSGPFILALYGAKWVAAAPPLVMLALASMVLVSLAMTWELFVVRQETARQARIEFLRMGAGVVMFGVGCIFGVTGAAASRVGEALFSIGLYRPHIDRMTDTRTADFLPIFGRSALLTGLAVAPAGAIMALHRASPYTPLPQLIAAIIVGFLLWLTAIKTTHHPLGAELNRLIASLRNRLTSNGDAGLDFATAPAKPGKINIRQG
jgi:O-antigen/teichoic acid export membrane protein